MLSYKRVEGYGETKKETYLIFASYIKAESILILLWSNLDALITQAKTNYQSRSIESCSLGYLTEWSRLTDVFPPGCVDAVNKNDARDVWVTQGKTHYLDIL